MNSKTFNDLLASVKEMLHYYAPGAQESAERNGEDSLHSAVRNARRAVREAEETGQPVIVAEQQKSDAPPRMLTSEQIAESKAFLKTAEGWRPLPCAATTEDILAAVDAEEELPGDMPDHLWVDLQLLDRAMMTEFLRAGVRATKAGIRKRLQTLFNHG